MKTKYLEVFKEASQNNHPLWQFNFSSLFQLNAITNVVEKKQIPFILGTSEGESEFIGLERAVALKKEVEKRLGLPIILNLDHGKSVEYTKKAIKAGYDMVHFDGSELSFKENLENTKKVTEIAKKKDVIVEGELGYLRGSSKFHKEKLKIKKEDMTPPKKAKEFVQKTGVEALAVSIGNVHGVWAEMPNLDLNQLNMIKKEVGGSAFLVLHGGSGISEKELEETLKNGITKINVNTEIRAAWRKGLEKTFQQKPDEVAPYKLAPQPIKRIEKVIERKLEIGRK